MKQKILSSKYYKLTLSLMTGVAILVATLAVTLYAKGYRLAQTGISETGQLVLKSEPDAASVFVNGKFVSATNSTLNLPPGEYDTKIVKDGYSPWEKKIVIQAQVVSPTDAILFPRVPEVRRFTTTGALNPTYSFDKTKIAYGVASSSAYPPKNGVYVADISDRQVFFSEGAQFVVRDGFVQYSAGKFLFSPDGRELLVYFESPAGEGEEEGEKTAYGGVNTQLIVAAYLFDTGRQAQEEAVDVSLNLLSVLDGWQKEKETERTIKINGLKSSIRKIASASFEIQDFTLDQSKFIYRAKEDAELPIIIKPRLVGVNSTPETRKIEKGKLYVYDLREDRNYEIKTEEEQVPLWLGTSRHYVTVEDSKIFVTEFDGQNKTSVYSGPFDKSIVVPSLGGNRIYFLTSFSPDLPLNLYALLIR